tara:strand:+ start:649 stop:756 length:108 start_codon:yes stop_codon:yes gene_type:complete
MKKTATVKKNICLSILLLKMKNIKEINPIITKIEL